MVPPVDVHGTGATNALSARSSERESWVDLVLDFDESIENHRAALVGVDVVSHVFWSVVWVVRVGTVDVKALHLALFFFGESLRELLGVVDLGDVRQVTQLWSRLVPLGARAEDSLWLSLEEEVVEGHLTARGSHCECISCQDSS